MSFFLDKEFSESRMVRITDAHIETDTGKSIHTNGSVFLDYNRAGTPLVEIVTHPDFRSAEEVIAFLKQLQRVTRFNDVGDADMDKGQMRVDVNISLRPEGTDAYGTRTETKNMNSFSGIGRAIAYEVERQTALLDA
jgi:aspartyl-tRNA(Asn)/glutamyl-tRNA(Gln) amidotransferase subunit B